MIPSESVLAASVAVLAADVALLIAFLSHISPKYQDYVVERRKLLDDKLKSEIKKHEGSDVTIEPFLPLFDEHEVIENWKNTLKQVLVQLGFSIFLAVFGLSICLVGYEITMSDIPVAVFFVVGGGLYFLLGLYSIIRHAVEVNEWRSQKK